jgi:uroporphyrinogen-III decarboxylase
MPTALMLYRQLHWQKSGLAKEVDEMAKTNAELYKERLKRAQDAIQLKVPDRVPVWGHDWSFFPAKYAGVTCEDLMCDDEKLYSAYKKTITELEPDIFFNPMNAFHTPGAALEIFGNKQVKWPGHGVPFNHSFQFIEGEYMKVEEYDAFLNDPTDYTLRTYLPRVAEAFASFNTLPPMTAFLLGYFGMSGFAAYAQPEIVKAMKSAYEGALAIVKHNIALSTFRDELKGLGFPCMPVGITLAPFDMLSDTLRGMRGLMLDMYRRPEKVVAAVEKLLPLSLGGGLSVKGTENATCFIPLHRGSDGFMSIKQFETFYWPTLKQLILTLVDAGITPCVFFEGDHTSRLEHYSDLPKGKVLGTFDAADPIKTKKILGNNMCISGLMPVSLLQTGSPEDIKAYAKKLIDIVGKDGGYIMGPRSAMDEADPDRVKIWMNYTKEYGVYK